jgi:ERF superfamily
MNDDPKLIAALCRKITIARSKLHSEPLHKSGKNKHVGYEYFELKDFMPRVVSIFEEIGLCGVVSFPDNQAMLRITDTESGAYLYITSPMSEAQLKGNHPIQNLGAVETYQRRYLWSIAMELTENDRLDSQEPLEDKVPEKVKNSTERVASHLVMDEVRKPHGDGPEWQTWVTRVLKFSSNERNGKVYVEFHFSNEKKAVTTDPEISAIAQQAIKIGEPVDIKVKQGIKGTKKWWWLEDVQEHEEESLEQEFTSADS